MATPPVAVKKVVQRYKTLKRANANGELVKQKVHVAEETERIAYCSTHDAHSKEYTGSNEHGWIFFCKGIPDSSSGFPHYFIAQAAPE